MLSLEGGGTKGAFQSGALKAFVELLNPQDIRYDVISGASVGSLNGILVAATEIGKEAEVSSKMSNLWATIKSDNVLANWP